LYAIAASGAAALNVSITIASIGAAGVVLARANGGIELAAADALSRSVFTATARMRAEAAVAAAAAACCGTLATGAECDNGTGYSVFMERVG
jgi:hypothetical protein